MTSEIYLRPLRAGDAEISYQWRNDPEIWKFTGSKPDRTITLEIEREWIEKKLQKKDEKRFAICLKESDRYIGNVQLTGINEYDAELHIFIGEKSFWGKGIGTSATHLLVEYAFDELKLQCVYLFVKKKNISAVRAYQKVGFDRISEVENENLWLAKYRMDRMPGKKVSVFMITYNHEKFIAQAIEGLLAQKTNFEFEVVIGDDNSPDGNQDIILSYARQNPDKLKLILHKSNIGAGRNQESVLGICKGEYLAVCEGDDYWTDPLKLQKQVDFLESNPGFAGSATQSLVIYENVEQESHVFREGVKNILTINDFIENRPFHTASFIFRNSIPVKEIPVNIVSADRVLYLLTACFGHICYFDEITCVYRKNDLSLSQNITSERLKNDLKIVPFISRYSSELDTHRLYAFIYETIIGYSHKITFRDIIISVWGMLYHTIMYKYIFRVSNHNHTVKNIVGKFYRTAIHLKSILKSKK